MRTVFMGSPEFGLPALENLAKNTQVLGVVTQPDRPAGRGRQRVSPPVKILAATLGIPVIQPEKLNSPESLETLQNWKPDLILVAAYGQILRQNVLDLPVFGCINLHASLLPHHRGAAPIAAAILAGDAETGISLMKMDRGLDTGPVLGQKSIPILPGDTTESLSRKLALLAADTLDEYLPVYIRGDLTPQPQIERLATYSPQLRKEDGRLEFQLPAIQLERKVRAYHPWPGTFVLWNHQPLKILSARVESENSREAVGTVLEIRRLPAIQTADGILELLEIQPAGKRPMPGDVFLRGAKGFLGALLTE